jgi:hypothetical protein
MELQFGWLRLTSFLVPAWLRELPAGL